MCAPYGVHSKTVRIRVVTSKGYVKEQLTEAFARYASHQHPCTTPLQKPQRY